jgi:GNAT superfamily N-acetyltransferase
MPTAIRPLTPADLPAAMRLKDLANWNQVEGDWLRILHFDPQGAFGLFSGGELAATATALTYGRDLAWIGMVLTHPEFRGRGFASQLMTACLEYLKARQVTEVKLDATDFGIGVYRRFGFVEECPIERWGRPAGPLPLDLPAPAAAPPDLALDLRAFGTDRAAVLDHLSRCSTVASAGDGFAMSRAGSRAAYIGPAVAATPETAKTLLASLVAPLASGVIYWDLFPGHPAAAIAAEFGFAAARALTRMSLVLTPGAPRITPHNELVYAIGGFELG